MSKGKRILNFAISMALLSCAAAPAAQMDDRWYLPPALSFIKADADRDSKNGPAAAGQAENRRVELHILTK